MITVFYLFLPKQQIALSHIPVGYPPPGIKGGMCDDATITTVVQ